MYAVDDEHLLLVASDRISAYDDVLPTAVPDKGAVLTGLSVWWFEQLADLVPAPPGLGATCRPAGRLQPHADGCAAAPMLCRRLDMVPVECVARGYLTGSRARRLPARRRRLRRRRCRPGLVDGAAAARAGLHPGDQGGGRRPRRERLLRRRSSGRRRATRRRAARADARGLRARRGAGRRAAASSWPTPSSSSAATATARCAGRRGADPGLLALLAGRRPGRPGGRSRRSTSSTSATGSTPPAGTDRPRPGAARRGRRAAPGPSTSRPTSGSPAAPSTAGCARADDPGPGTRPATLRPCPRTRSSST